MRLKEAMVVIPEDAKVTLWKKEIRLWTGQMKTLRKRFGILHLTGEEEIAKVQYHNGKIVVKVN